MGYVTHVVSVIVWFCYCDLHIKELIITKVGADELQTAEGLTKFLEALDEAFKPTSQCKNLQQQLQRYEEEE